MKENQKVKNRLTKKYNKTFKSTASILFNQTKNLFLFYFKISMSQSKQIGNIKQTAILTFKFDYLTLV